MPRPAGNPATADVEIDEDAVALANAVQAWKERTDRTFPTFHELCEILDRLGWARP